MKIEANKRNRKRRNLDFIHLIKQEHGQNDSSMSQPVDLDTSIDTVQFFEGMTSGSNLEWASELFSARARERIGIKGRLPLTTK